MARKSFSSTLKAIARETARKQREAERARIKAIKEADRAERKRRRAVEEAERARTKASSETLKAQQRTAKSAAAQERAREKEWKLAEKEAHDRYLRMREEEVAELNVELAENLEHLGKILDHTLAVDDAISFNSLRMPNTFRSFDPPAELITSKPEPDRTHYFADIKEPGRLSGLLPMTRKAHADRLAEAESKYSEALRLWEATETARLADLEQFKTDYEHERQAYLDELERTDKEIDEFEAAYRAADPEAIIAYNGMVLERSEYPEGFPQEFRLAYLPESKELVIEYELPGTDVIPTVTEYKFTKSKDTIEDKPAKPAAIKELYQDVVASVALRTLHEVFEADQAEHLAVAVFNGFVQTVDPATGKDIRPCLISVRVTRDRIGELNLSRVDKKVCLRNLGAQVSPRPAEMQAVRPIVDFDMVDKRFVEQSDVLSDLESRPNLMDLSPFEFEHLVSNLFHSMGLESKLTRSSRDGGVDCVAFDTRPILGGKVVIQAKRYSNTVGVSAVRDLYGTMMNEGANKGILVSTAGYGPDAYDFARDKPIELIDGGGLLYLLEQQGVHARIVFLEPSQG